MTSRERMFRCLEFRNPDRAPRDLWATPYVPQFRKGEWDQILQEFPVDLMFPAGDFLPADERRREQGPTDNSYVDDWGCVWTRGEPGVAGEVREYQLADWSALATYRAPWKRIKEGRWHETAKEQDANLASANPRFLIGWSAVNPFERMQFLRGTENLMMDLAYDTAEVRRLRDLVHEFNMAELQGWCSTAVDGVVMMDDWGSQTSLLISPAMWREMFKPLYKDYCDLLHSAGKKIFFHSDGNITSIFGDLVELGMDAVNSQLFVMDIEELARLYKGRATFWGELDRQFMLPFGTAQDVRKGVGRVRRALDDGKGGVLAMLSWSSHDPIENIQTAFQAWDAPLASLP